MKQLTSYTGFTAVLEPDTGTEGSVMPVVSTPTAALAPQESPAVITPAAKETPQSIIELPQETPEALPLAPIDHAPTPVPATPLALTPVPQEGSIQPEDTAAVSPLGEANIGVSWLLIAAIVLAAAVSAAAVFLLRRRSHHTSKTAKQPIQGGAVNGSLGSGIGIGNASHIGSRSNQQDSFGLSDVLDAAQVRTKGAAAIVADGMGGLNNGADVSAIVTHTMLQSFDRLPGDMDPAMRLLSMVEDANRQVNLFLNGGSGSGSTVVAALIQNNMLYTISVGDSRIYLYRNGALMQINREHTYGVELDEKAARGEITMEAAKNDRQRHALTSYIGMGEIAKIDRTLAPLPLQHGDKVALMSDGVFGTLTNEELAQCLVADAAQAAGLIEQAVLNKQKPQQDNFTVIVLEIQ